jgi:hypothetical protein
MNLKYNDIKEPNPMPSIILLKKEKIVYTPNPLKNKRRRNSNNPKLGLSKECKAHTIQKELIIKKTRHDIPPTKIVNEMSMSR